MVPQSIPMQFDQFDAFDRSRRTSYTLVATLLLAGIGVASFERSIESGSVGLDWQAPPHPVRLAPGGDFQQTRNAPAPFVPSGPLAAAAAQPPRPATAVARHIVASPGGRPTVARSLDRPQTAGSARLDGAGAVSKPGHRRPAQPARPPALPAPQTIAPQPALTFEPVMIDADSFPDVQVSASVTSAPPTDEIADVADTDLMPALATASPPEIAMTPVPAMDAGVVTAAPDPNVDRARVADRRATPMAGADAPRPQAIDLPAHPARSAARTANASVAASHAEPTGGTSAPTLAPVQPIGRPHQVRDGIAFEVSARVNGATMGRLSLLIAGGDIRHPEYTCDDISVRLADLLVILSPRMDQKLFQALNASQAAEQYVTFNDLRAHGIAVSFDRHDRLLLKTA